jgi:hypothetical protein
MIASNPTVLCRVTKLLNIPFSKAYSCLATLPWYPAQLLHITIQNDTRIEMSLGQGPSLMSCSENLVLSTGIYFFPKIYKMVVIIFLIKNPSDLITDAHSTTDLDSPDPTYINEQCVQDFNQSSENLRHLVHS